ncbi:Gamma-secretase-activating protein [Collichthys lucidus]|uniref:Gamma-secretase-activating protein n=1 Tax=Collichthys lucidus TaxID=240159 RepID=A0A4U5VTQ4_COLLU|nr:Gamma-secretase-activating protein [Collichthys lucidus]
MLLLNPKFDLHRDVACDLLRKEASVCRVQEYSGAVDTRILNIERDGGILFSWKGATGTTRIGKYDPNTKQNKLLYTFDKQVCVSSCSLNKEETLLVSKCLTLLIEIHPISNTKVLKAVDCRVKVQFLNSETDRRSVLESHLLLLTEDGYVDLYHVLLTRQEGYRVVMANPERLSRTVERIVEDFCWVQWDGHTQRLYCLTHNDKFLMRCVQFYLNHNCETVMELPLELPANPFRTVKFVNLGFDHYHMERPEQELVKMEVLTNRTGSMFVCYSQPLRDNQNLIYTVVSVHKDCSKTFRASLGSEQSPQQKATQLHPLFIPIGPDLHLDPQYQSANLTVLHAEEESSASLLDLASGRIYTPALSPAYLLQMLQSDTPSRCCSSKTDPQCLAALHCLLVYMGNDPTLELKIIEWLCDNVKAFESFDQIQEFILEVREETIQPHESHGGEHKEVGLPPTGGYHTLLAVFAVRCLPHHTFLQYIDQGILQLTETFVSRLMTALDPFEEQENVDARFVEETALKQTLVLLGFEEK